MRVERRGFVRSLNCCFSVQTQVRMRIIYTLAPAASRAAFTAGIFSPHTIRGVVPPEFILTSAPARMRASAMDS